MYLSIIIYPHIKGPVYAGAVVYFVIFNNSVSTASGINRIINKIHTFSFPPLPKIKMLNNAGYPGDNTKTDWKHAHIKHKYSHFYIPH